MAKKKKESLLAGFMDNYQTDNDVNTYTPEKKEPIEPKEQPVKPTKMQKPVVQVSAIEETEKKFSVINVEKADLLNTSDEILPASLEKRRESRFTLVFFVFLILSLYVAFLIIGILNSRYVYDENGNAVIERVSVQDIKEEKEYSTIMLYYSQMKDIYKEVIILDIELEKGTDNYIELASEYEELLDKTSKIYKEINALKLSTKYDNILAMMKQWIYEDLPVYLQNISGAISQNDTNKAQQAVLGQTVMDSNFNLITTNIVGLGKSINADVEEFENWNRTVYRKEKLGI